jgi:membrane protein
MQVKRKLIAIEHFVKHVLSSLFSPFVIFSKRLILPGFHGVPLYDVIIFFIRGARRSSITLRSNSLTYSFMMAFFPAVIFFFTLIPYIPIIGLKDNILITLHEMIPQEAFLAIQATIEDIITRAHGELLSFSILISFYFASTAIMNIMDTFNQSSHLIETRTKFKKIWTSLTLFLILSFLIIISAGALALSSLFLYFMERKGLIHDNTTIFLLTAGKWTILTLTALFSFSSIYYLAPVKRGSFPFFSTGSVFSTIISIVFFRLFSFFINNFGTYNTFYGSIGTLIVIILWINLNAMFMLIGYELNASIYVARIAQERKSGNGEGEKEPPKK